jgi:hypothetical protein
MRSFAKPVITCVMWNSIVIPSDSLAHHYVQTQFRNSRSNVRREIGRNLSRLRTMRNQADYSDAIPALPALTKAMLRLARRSMFLLDNL